MLNVSSHHSCNSSYLHTKRAAQEMVRKLAIYTIKLQKKCPQRNLLTAKRPANKLRAEADFLRCFIE